MHTVTSCLIQQLTSTVRQRGKVGGRRGRRGEVSREGGRGEVSREGGREGGGRWVGREKGRGNSIT